jgi:glyoxylase-like metal-dependent hydrolase (beta-lactamase superfamily II)
MTSYVLRRDVAPGVHQIEHAYTNCYLIEDGDGLTVVDAGFPSTGRAMLDLLARVGRTVNEIHGLVLTHGHFDHVGFARGLRRQLGTPIWVHTADRRLAEHPYRYRPERNRFVFPLGHPRGLPILGAMVTAGALTVRGVTADHDLSDGQVLDLPGHPVVLHLPGHTAGQCALLLPERDTVLTGDALVTLDPYTGNRGPRLVARAATADGVQALASLDRLHGCGASNVLPGHGPTWTDGVDAAVSLARGAGIS